MEGIVPHQQHRIFHLCGYQSVAARCRYNRSRYEHRICAGLNLDLFGAGGKTGLRTGAVKSVGRSPIYLLRSFGTYSLLGAPPGGKERHPFGPEPSPIGWRWPQAPDLQLQWLVTDNRRPLKSAPNQPYAGPTPRFGTLPRYFGRQVKRSL